ncbi:MAG: hypothetical protein U5P41_11425 [Gammaproteobacteria bacterium]|nr:hypothetical protein [Gammaproteobacteria bacterium]
MNNDTDNRSPSSTEADGQAEKLMEQREHVLWFFVAILIVAEIVVYYFKQPGWIGIVVAIGWLGILLANELKLIYHELIELNDQISGRKEEFKKIVKK